MSRYKPRLSVHYYDTLHKIRREAKISKTDFARSVGVDSYTISKIESGKQKPNQAIVNAYGLLVRRM